MGERGLLRASATAQLTRAPRLAVVAVVAALLLGGSDVAGGSNEPAQFFDPSLGEIDGRVAVAVVPASYADHRVEEILPWQGFQAHFSPLGEPEFSFDHPAGEWFAPSPGRYRVWVSGNWKASPYSRLIGYAGERFTDRGQAVVVPVVDAGRVTIRDPGALDPEDELRLLYLGPYWTGRILGYELVMKSSIKDLASGLLMPVGRSIAAVWDVSSGSYSRLSRPFVVDARMTHDAPLGSGPLEKRAHLVVQMRRESAARGPADAKITARLATQDQVHAVGATAEAAEVVYLIWYDVPAGKAMIEFAASGRAPIYREMELRPGFIERLVVFEPRTLDLEGLESERADPTPGGNPP